MTTRITMRKATLLGRLALAALLALFMGACTTANDQAPKFSDQGQHPANWVNVHWSEFLKNQDSCKTCHGSVTDKAAAGGISGVSCFSCHPSGPTHTAGWAAPSQHGRLGAQLAPSSHGGFAYCAKCHGSTYDNGLAVSCKSCHTRAPHPSAPWIGTSLSTPGHAMTDAGNAPECAKCHTNGANSRLKPNPPAPAGTVPGCFNNTLCHGRSFE